MAMEGRDHDGNLRFANLPLVLAGPILRRTTAESVTVWIALKSACTVELQIYSTTNSGHQISKCLSKGQRSTIALGQFLHIVAVTAQCYEPLQPNQIYAYDLQFEQLDLDQALASSHVPRVNISYFDHCKPTFVLPPDRAEELKIVQGSCRF
jgi:hypothetical protein